MCDSPLAYRVTSRNADSPSTQNTTPLLAAGHEQGDMDRPLHVTVALCWMYVRKYSSENVYHQRYIKTLADNNTLTEKVKYV